MGGVRKTSFEFCGTMESCFYDHDENLRGTVLSQGFIDLVG